MNISRGIHLILRGTAWILRRALLGRHEAKEKMIEAEGLAGPVRIYYDRAGVPHIWADSELDAYFAQGYVTAESRLWQLDLLRRTAAGKLSEAFGRRMLAGDIFQRKLGLERLAKEKVSKLHPGVTERIMAYSRGVNLFIQKAPLPIEFAILGIRPEPWAVLDSMLCVELRSVLNASWRADLVLLEAAVRAGPERAKELFLHYEMPDHGELFVSLGGELDRLLKELLDTLQESEDALKLVGLEHNDIGTNTFVADGRLTSTGKPILANDPHMGFVVPNLNFLVHLKSPNLHVRGIAFPGVPGVPSGHNEHIAWGAAVLMADTQDVFIEEFDESGGEYLFLGKWLPVETWTETIHIRDAPSKKLVIRRTLHGPVIQSYGRWGLALRWERLDTPPADPTFHDVNSATDWESFRQALSQYTGPANDFTFADVKGNIGVQSAGCLPLRALGDGSLPVTGKDGKHEWTGYIPFDEMPSLFRPASGYVARSNQNHDAGACGHFLSRRWHPPHRARRIQELLAKDAGQHTVESFSHIQFDRYSEPGSFLRNKLLPVIEEESEDELWRSACAALRAWNGQLDPESNAASIIKECWAILKTLLLVPVLGKRLLLEYQKNWPAFSLAIERILDVENRQWLPDGISSFTELYQSVFAKAIDNLRRTFGSEQIAYWHWGKLHSIRFSHPLDRVPFLGKCFQIRNVEVGGDGECIFAARSVGDYISTQQGIISGDPDARAAIFGASARLIWDLASWDNSSMLLNLGQSGNPFSPHYRDQLPLWQTGEVQKLPFSWELVRKTSIRTVNFSQKLYSKK